MNTNKLDVINTELDDQLLIAAMVKYELADEAAKIADQEVLKLVNF